MSFTYFRIISSWKLFHFDARFSLVQEWKGFFCGFSSRSGERHSIDSRHLPYFSLAHTLLLQPLLLRAPIALWRIMDNEGCARIIIGTCFCGFLGSVSFECKTFFTFSSSPVCVCLKSVHKCVACVGGGILISF
jgi:hypothetical protein